MRNRRFGQPPRQSVMKLEPGAYIGEYASREGWPFGTHNIIVEGTSDQEYFHFADELYYKKYKKNLLVEDLTLFAVGDREKGGTKALRTKFRTVRDILKSDPLDAKGRAILVLCILDNDSAGRGLFNALRSDGFVAYSDMFLLHRVIPCKHGNAIQIEKYIQEANQKWKSWDCEIEDLLSRDLLECFVESNKDSLKRPRDIAEDGHRFDFHEHAKPELLRFVKEYAALDELHKIIDLLKSIRFLLKLDKDGV